MSWDLRVSNACLRWIFFRSPPPRARVTHGDLWDPELTSGPIRTGSTVQYSPKSAMALLSLDQIENLYMSRYLRLLLKCLLKTIKNAYLKRLDLAAYTVDNHIIFMWRTLDPLCPIHKRICWAQKCIPHRTYQYDNAYYLHTDVFFWSNNSGSYHDGAGSDKNPGQRRCLSQRKNYWNM